MVQLSLCPKFQESLRDPYRASQRAVDLDNASYLPIALVRSKAKDWTNYYSRVIVSTGPNHPDPARVKAESCMAGKPRVHTTAKANRG